MAPSGSLSGEELNRLAAARLADGAVSLPVGVAWTPNELYTPVHIIDGDGASWCEHVQAADLVAIPNRAWHEVEAARRCRPCGYLVAPPVEPSAPDGLANG